MLDGLLITDQRLPFQRVGIAQIVAQEAALEDRLYDVSRVTVNYRGRGDGGSRTREGGSQEGAVAPGSTSGTGERKLREEQSFGHSDVGVRSDQVLLGLADVGSALKQIRREARR